MLFKKRRRSRKKNFLARIFRSFVAVVILTAFVLGVALATKQVATMDAKTFAKIASPVTQKLGISEEKTGEVAGEFIERFSQTGINKETPVDVKYDARYDSDSKDMKDVQSDSDSAEDDGEILTSDKSKRPLVQVALLADAHEDWDNLEAALEEAEDLDVDQVFFLGDFTDWGDVPGLKNGKEMLDESGLAWEALPGDHDLAQSASKTGGGGLENFLEVFGHNYGTTKLGGYTFMYFDNSANFTPLDEERFTWFLDHVEDADFVLLAQPIYHDKSLILMGIVDGEEIEDVNNQRKMLLSKVRQAEVKAVVAADHHMSSVSKDPERASLRHFVVGALASSRNLQTPRFSVLSVYADGSYTLDEVVL